MAGVDWVLERNAVEGTFPAGDDAIRVLLRCDETQDLIEQDHYLAWDEVLGTR